MNGKSDEEILRERQQAIYEAKMYLGDEVEVIDTYYTDFSPNAKPLEYLGRSLMDLAKADIAYFSKDWESGRGCRIEHECAMLYDIPVLHYNDKNAIGKV